MTTLRGSTASWFSAGLVALAVAVGCDDDQTAQTSEAVTTYYTPTTGPVVHNVQLDVVYWSNAVPNQVDITSFYDVVTNSPYIDWMAQYAASRGSLHAQLVDTSSGNLIEDVAIQTRLAALIDANADLAINANTVYMLHFPPGMAIRHQGETLCESSGIVCPPGQPCPMAGSCGYHGTFVHGGQRVTYSVIPDMTSGQCNANCEKALSNPLDKTTAVASHELIEAITDPNLTITGENEVADICENTGNAADLNGSLSVGGNPARMVNYTVAKGWSNQDNRCITFAPQGGQYMTPVPADYDGDGITDIAVRDNVLGIWHIDYAKNGFGGWDESHAGYGFSDSIPVPADYDGDHAADLSVKDNYGNWFIDFSRDGFGTWNKQYTGYGFADATPVPADYDGDGYADLSVKNSTDGVWYIDYHGVGNGDEYGFGHWDVSYAGYGFSNIIPVPADYDGDGKADLAIKTTDGYWMIDVSNNPNSTDYRLNQFGGWNYIFAGYGFSNATPTPAFYDLDPAPHQTADLSVWDGTTWYLDNSTQWTGGAQFGHWDLAFTPSNTGWTSATPVPGDYDHDGVADLALFVRQYGQCWWYVSDSSKNPRDTGHPNPAWNHYYNLSNR